MNAEYGRSSLADRPHVCVVNDPQRATRELSCAVEPCLHTRIPRWEPCSWRCSRERNRQKEGTIGHAEAEQVLEADSLITFRACSTRPAHPHSPITPCNYLYLSSLSDGATCVRPSCKVSLCGHEWVRAVHHFNAGHPPPPLYCRGPLPIAVSRQPDRRPISAQ